MLRFSAGCTQRLTFITRVARYCSAAAENRKKSYYDILGVTSKATTEELKSAFFELSKIHHPDVADADTDKFLEIKEAYEVLKDAEKRLDYDLGNHSPFAREPTLRRSYNTSAWASESKSPVPTRMPEAESIVHVTMPHQRSFVDPTELMRRADMEKWWILATVIFVLSVIGLDFCYAHYSQAKQGRAPGPVL